MAERLDDGRLAPVAAIGDFEQAFFEAVFEWQIEIEPELAAFDGEIHGRKVREFVDLDRQRIQAAAMQVAGEHHKRAPPLGGGGLGPLGVLKGEIARRRGHMPIRQLMQKAAPAIQSLKPVFMMSPLSVAQFLPPGSLKFDILIMDEASQIQPVDALGAIARCRQVVVVGDPQQLPPTAFFAKITGQTDSDDDDGAAKVGDIESILGLFTARGLQLKMLRWHYRSRHESLIAVSNNQFYKDKLVIIPSPFTKQSGLGLRFHHVQAGIFESGTTRTNPVEADAVAHAIIEHAQTKPEQSLGVVAFSAAQRKAILEKLELLRRQLPEAQEAFFQARPTEPFFIKNLENVQGRKVEDASLKAIAALANHRGGTLLIGVHDLGMIKGLGPDFATFGDSRDKFELHLTNLIKDRFSESFRVGCVSVSYPTKDGMTICRVDVKRSRSPVYLKVSDGAGPATERLIVRAGASSPEIPLSQVADYVRDHFGR